MPAQLSHIRNQSSNQLLILPFGGCGEFGRNATGYINQNQFILVDCGLMFPDPTKLGVSSIIPNLSPFFTEIGIPDAYLMTHGHEDHIGGLAHIVKEWPAPIYATEWTAMLLREKFAALGMDEEQFPITVVKAGDTVSVGEFSVDWLHVNHSIPMACALNIKTPQGTVLHTGDFKIDPDPIGEPPMDLADFRNLGKVDLLVADSTNAITPGPTPGEKSAGAALEEVVKNCTGTVFITTFSSNLWRLMSIMQLAKTLKKKLLVLGRGLERCMRMADECKWIDASDPVFIGMDKIQHIDPAELVVIATGCQGEYFAAMPRVARNEHKDVRLRPDDTVVFSSRMIPGNEKQVIAMVDFCYRRGAQIITPKDNPKIHVSGHAHQEDLAAVISAVSPKYLIAVHGNFSHQLANESIAVNCKTHSPTNGQLMSYSKKAGLKVEEEFQVEPFYVDNMSQHLLPPSLLKGRLRIGESGLVLISGCYSSKKGRWLVEPEIVTVGIPPLTNSLNAKAVKIIDRFFSDSQQHNIEELNEECRISVRRHLSNFYGKKVVVVPKLFVVD